MKVFDMMTNAQKLKHVERCLAEGREEVKKGSSSQLADIADHFDIWGPWLVGRVKELEAAFKAACEMRDCGIINKANEILCRDFDAIREKLEGVQSVVRGP